MMCTKHPCRSTFLRIKLLNVLIFCKILSRGTIETLSKYLGSLHVDRVDIRPSYSLTACYRVGTLDSRKPNGSIQRDWQCGTCSKRHHSISYLDAVLILVVDELG